MLGRAMRQQYLDSAAIAASLLCLVHCLAIPAILIFLPTAAAFLSLPESFHAWAFAFAIPTSALALGSGVRRHRHAAPAGLAAVGLVLLGLGAFAATTPAMETVLTVPGAMLLAIGHAWNWRALRHGPDAARHP